MKHPTTDPKNIAPGWRVRAHQRSVLTREPHLIEVQGGGARGWWMVDGADLADGAPAVELDFYNDVCNPLRRRRPRSRPGSRWFFGPPGPRAIPADDQDTFKFAYNRPGVIVLTWAALLVATIAPAPHAGLPMALYLIASFAVACAVVIGLERLVPRRPGRSSARGCPLREC
ncbi:hypothetical protein AB0B28_20350 [Glycomyces sp. NPDC046736]|uniref:hypothetical protein n=1 Tax=Glycomyces sp. NPDC046736 TaxID=3155615 RepID=UPI0033F2E9BE